MPPAALIVDCDSFGTDQCLGGIEVEALGKRKGTRISLSPREEDFEEKKQEDADPNRYAYFQQHQSNDQTLADSFDEIAENSNEARLINRIAHKAYLGDEEAINGYAQNPQDSLFNDETESKYLDVLDEHIEQTNPGMTTSYLELENDVDGKYPKKEEAGVDEIMATLLDSCCACDDDYDYTAEPLRSSLRSPKWSKKNPNTNVTPSKVDPSVHVVFKDVDILEFKMTLGDHPSACSGPPIRIDWENKPEQIIITLDEYEQGRQPRRSRRNLKLSLQERHNLLVKERGFTFEEVKTAWHDSLEIRKQRKETLERGLALMKWDEVWESTCRKFDRIVYGSYYY